MRLVLSMCFAVVMLISTGIQAQTLQMTDKTIQDKVSSIMSKMSLEEKIGQMIIVDYIPLHFDLQSIVKYNIGNVLFGPDSDPDLNTAGTWASYIDSLQNIALSSNLKIPLFIAADAVRGHNNISNGTFFPHNIAMGCTRNSRLVMEEGKITATELAATGVRLAFSPCYIASQDIRWGGTFESYSENESIVKTMSQAYNSGFNSTVLPDGGKVVNCPKIFGNVSLVFDEGVLSNKLNTKEGALFSFDDSLIVNSKSLYVRLDQLAENGTLLNSLKKNPQFNGFVVGDWESVNSIPEDYYTIIKKSVNAGVDMFIEMSTYKKFFDAMKLCVASGDISNDRIDDAVRRILYQKVASGLFEHPMSYPELMEKINSKSSKNIVRTSVRESVVLLTNKNNILPLSKKEERIHIAGSGANNLAMQCGGYTIGWQGLEDKEMNGTTIMEAIKQTNTVSKITYSKNGQGASGADVGIVVIGEQPYADWFGSKKELFLSQEDINTVMNVKNAGVPVVCIILSGRPVILDPILNYCDAIVAAWLPGSDATGIVDVLYGDVNPIGKLSFTWPSAMNQVPLNKDSQTNALFPFGSGITTYDASQKIPSARIIMGSVVKNGAAIEVSFSKPITDTTAFTKFSVLVANKPVTVVASDIKKETKSIVLLLSDSVKVNQKVTLSLNSNGLKSSDRTDILPINNFIVFNPLTSFRKIYKIPAMIQAEKYTDQRDIDIQECWDDRGGQSVMLEKGEWVEYLLQSTFPGYYDVVFRVKSEKKAELILSVDGRDIGTVKVKPSKSGAWTSTTLKHVYITNGKQSFTVRAKNENVALNWISFEAFVNFVSN